MSFCYFINKCKGTVLLVLPLKMLTLSGSVGGSVEQEGEREKKVICSDYYEWVLTLAGAHSYLCTPV